MTDPISPCYNSTEFRVMGLNCVNMWVCTWTTYNLPAAEFRRDQMCKLIDKMGWSHFVVVKRTVRDEVVA